MFGTEGAAIGCIGAALPATRSSPAAPSRDADTVVAAARGLSARLGHHPGA